MVANQSCTEVFTADKGIHRGTWVNFSFVGVSEWLQSAPGGDIDMGGGGAEATKFHSLIVIVCWRIDYQACANKY